MTYITIYFIILITGMVVGSLTAYLWFFKLRTIFKHDSAPKTKEEPKEVYDIVYVLRNDERSHEELRYSLRTLKNLPHGKIWFAGGQPDGFKPDGRIPFEQKGKTPYEKVKNTIKKICLTEGVSKNFYLFNDDFFILKPMEKIGPVYDYSIHKMMVDIEKTRGRSKYVQMLDMTIYTLNKKGLTCYNYALHIPMLINKEKGLEVLHAFPACQSFRNMYGNYCQIGGINHEDCKIARTDLLPGDDWKMVSTSNDSFKKGKVGNFLRERFPEKSPYEE